MSTAALANPTATTTTTRGAAGEGKSSNGNAQSSTASTFSFKTPAPPPSATTTTTTTSSLPGPLKQRRVSLALPSSPRVVEGWSFRDDTGLDKAGHETGGGGGRAAKASGEAPLLERVRKVESPSEPHQPLLPPGPSSSTPEKLVPEKKARKKWTPEETQMLVTGCNKHGVGNWKTILRDPTLKFDNRSPVDLKDRFRTYFPDAYKQHYPNAKTHLSSKVRSTLPDGSSIFEKTRSKRRRPFTEEEDRALKEGYEKYGTVWATIVKDYPIFQEQNRRSTDLRDRFRNAFPELYQLAGYKPRNHAKKKMVVAAAAAAAAQAEVAPTGISMSMSGNSTGTATGTTTTTTRRAATDDQLGTTSTGGPVRSRRRAHTNQGLLRGGTKSVPQSTACTEDEDSSGGEDEGQVSPPPPFKLPSSALPPSSFISDVVGSGASSPSKTPPDDNDINDILCETDEDDSMDMITLDLADALALPADFMPPTQEPTGHQHAQHHPQHQHPHPQQQQHAWSSGVSTPTHSNHWSTAAGSPTSSHLSSDLLMGGGGSSSSPFLSSTSIHQRRDGSSGSNHHSNNTFSVGGMIGKSAWGTDWFSPNPRLDPSSSGAYPNANANPSATSNTNNAYMHEHPSPASPFSFHQLNQGVMDRYDLLPTTSSMISDFSSEVGVGDTHSTFSDDVVFQHHPGGFGGFTHHSSYAGDLIFSARTHQPVHNSSGGTGGSGGGSFFSSGGGLGAAAGGGGGGGAFGFGSLGLTGLSLSAMATQSAGIHPMQLHTPSIYSATGGLDDPTGIGGLALDDPHTGPDAGVNGGGPGGVNGGGAGGGGGGVADPLGIPLPPESMDEDLREDDVAMGDVSAPHSHHAVASPSRQALQSGQSSPSKRPEFLHHHHHHHHNHHAALQEQQRKDAENSKAALMAAEPFSLDDLVDLSNELHTTPPATPLTHPRPIRSANSSGSNHGFNGGAMQGSSTSSLHARSVSVPPSEFRNSVVIQNNSISALLDYDYDEGQLQLQQRGLASFLGGGGGTGQGTDLNSLSAALGVVRQLNLFPPSISQQLSQGEQVQQQQQQQQMVDAGRVGRGIQRGARMSAMASASPSSSRSRAHAGTSGSAVNDGIEEDELGTDPRPQTPTLASSRHLMSLPTSPVTPHSSLPSTSSSSSSHQSPQHQRQQQQLASLNLPMNLQAPEMYNLPFLDLHYYGHGGGAAGLGGSSIGSVLHAGGLVGTDGTAGLGFGGSGMSDAMGSGGQTFMQAQALDLAATSTVRYKPPSETVSVSSIFGEYLANKSQQTQQQQSPPPPPPQPQQQQQQYESPQRLHHLQQQQHRGYAGSQAQPVSPTIRQHQGGIFKTPAPPVQPSGLGRSQSHHRGLSAINPQDIMMRSADGNKRKRMSWDGRQV